MQLFNWYIHGSVSFYCLQNYLQNKLFLSKEIFMMIKEVQGKWFSDAFKKV